MLPFIMIFHQPITKPLPYPISWIKDVAIDNRATFTPRPCLKASKNIITENRISGEIAIREKIGLIKRATNAINIKKREPRKNAVGKRCTSLRVPLCLIKRWILAIPELKTCLKKVLKVFLRLWYTQASWKNAVE